MDEYFSEIQNQPAAEASQHSIGQSEPLQSSQPFVFSATTQYPPVYGGSGSQSQVVQGGSASSFHQQDNEFNDFQEDQTTRRIRQEQDKIQKRLREKSEKQYEDKNKRRQEGRKQLDEFLQKRQTQKRERAQQNVKKEEDCKKEYAKINTEAGWKKVVTNVNLKMGEYKGKKDINRMREAILHRRQDDPR